MVWIRGNKAHKDIGKTTFNFTIKKTDFEMKSINLLVFFSSSHEIFFFFFLIGFVKLIDIGLMEIHF